MEEELLSNSWYRVAELRPRLRSHAQIHRHRYRGRTWYVLQDHASGRIHRFSSEAYHIIGLMDGRRSLAAIWDAACARLGDDMLTQDDVLQLLAQLHQADVLQTDVTPDIGSLFERRVRLQRSKTLSYIRSPVSLRFPLLDPDRFLDRTQRFVRPIFGPAGLALWAVAFVSGIAVVGLHWDEVTSNVADRVFTLQNLMLVGLIYPVLKALHEFGHAYAVKRWGGEVHEMGIMLLVFMPIPYVDASSASAFREKHRRIVVGAIGILVETCIAGLAALVWAFVEPGSVRAVAYNTMLIAGISSLAFNGNPLLRFDAYYVLSDLLEIPNLGSRGSRYLNYLIQRYVLGIGTARSPATGPGEAGWLVAYALASFVYRMFIMVAIVLLAASRFLAFGVVIAGWVVFNLLWPPLSKAAKFLFDNPQARGVRVRVGAVGVGAAALIIALLGLVPFPLFTTAEGIVWVPERARVRAGVDGFVSAVIAPVNGAVSTGEPLIRCVNPDLAARVSAVAARLTETQALHRAALSDNRNRAEMLADEIEQVRAELKRFREQQDELVLRAAADGIFILPQPEDLPNTFVQRGAELGYVASFERTTIRVVVLQADAGLVRRDTRRAEVRLASSLTDVIPAEVVREVPAATADLPSLTLSMEGGGSLALDPRSSDSPQSLERLFQFDLEVVGGTASGVEERAMVRFEHTPEPLVFRWYRDIRRLLMKRFNV